MKPSLIVSLVVLAAWGSSEQKDASLPGPSPSEDASLDSSADDGGKVEGGATKDVATAPLATCVMAEGVCSGTLDPTSLGVGISAVRSSASNKDGRHYFCYPIDSSKVNGRFLVHVVGTGSDPQIDLAVTRRMCALGFVVLAPMYVNDKDGRSTCGADSDCFEGFRREIVQGSDAISGVTVDAANSIEGRVSSALAKLASTEPAYASFVAFRNAFAGRDFSKVVLSGHSQGSGHALYLAREYAAASVVLLAGPSDRLPPPANAPAKWIAGFSARTKTSPSKIYGFISEDDGIQGFSNVMDTWTVLGMSLDSCAHSTSGVGFSASCRRVVLPPAGCAALDAHSVVVAENFDAACRSGRPPNRNTATWKFLFGPISPPPSEGNCLSLAVRYERRSVAAHRPTRRMRSKSAGIAGRPSSNRGAHA